MVNNEGLKSLIKMAGGLKATTYMKRVSISRVLPPKDRIALDVNRTLVDVNLNDLYDSKSDFELFDSDIVTFFSITKEEKNIVEINGAVKRPGKYDLGSGVRLLDLIENADGLTKVLILKG